jgi:hypothetical protein
MRSKKQFWAIVFLMALNITHGQENAKVLDLASIEAARNRFINWEQTKRLIEGKKLVVRVYPNLYEEPEKYVKTSVHVMNSSLQLSEIKAAFPLASRFSYIFFQASDQTDPFIASALDGIVLLTSYSENPWPLQMQTSNKPYDPYWTFLDAFGKPMAGASVEIRLLTSSGTNDAPSVYVGNATLDDKGRFQRILSSGGPLNFVVQHPRYGVASVSFISNNNDSNIYVVPLAPKDSPEAPLLQGTVLDSSGRPVQGANVNFTSLEQPSPQPGQKTTPTNMRLYIGSITDEKGQFNYCEPVISEDFTSIHPAPAGSRFRMSIQPPKHLNLRQLSAINQTVIQAGNYPTFALTPMSSDTAFHTFAFKLPDREIASADELGEIILILIRDGRTWTQLAYPDFKDGRKLPSGMLRAMISGRGRMVSFPEIDITSDSPKLLVFKAPTPITCRGKVIDETTGKPMAGVYVTTASYGSGDPNSWTIQQWQNLQFNADQTVRDESPGYAIYDLSGKVFVTDASGSFTARFAPRDQAQPLQLTALAPGYAQSSVIMVKTLPTGSVNTGSPGRLIVSLPQPNTDGIIETPTIKMTPSERIYFPQFVFEDKDGRVTDPNRLNSVHISYKGASNNGSMSLDQFLRIRTFYPGIYSADATWNSKYYTYEPVDLTTARPDIVVFKLQKVQTSHIIYKGQVISEVTGKPIWGAVVIYSTFQMTSDASSFQLTQWNALKSLGAKPDQNNSDALQLQNLLYYFYPGQTRFPFPFAVTNQEGQFQIAVEQGKLSSSNSFLGFVAKGCLGVDLWLSSPGNPNFIQQIDPDENGVIAVPILKMPPAATIRIHPVIQDTGASSAPAFVTLAWKEGSEAHRNWTPFSSSFSPNAIGMRMLTQTKSRLQANIDQTAYIPARISVSVKAFPPEFASPQTSPPFKSGLLPANLGIMNLYQGQIKVFGQIKFHAPIEIIVKAVDTAGKPLTRLSIQCEDYSEATDDSGVVRFKVGPYSSGKFVFSSVSLDKGLPVETSIPYIFNGPKDAGKMFTLQIPESYLGVYRSLHPKKN